MDLGSVIGRQRKPIMGVAALLIICFHAYWGPDFFLWNMIVNRYGNIGVDIFVFVAGFGIAHSLDRDPDFYRFYKRRMMRILPPYYVAVTIIMISYILAGNISLRWIFSNCIPGSFWIGGSAEYWYVSATIVYYALAPLFFQAIKRARFPRIMMLVLLTVFSIMIPSFSGLPKIAELRMPVMIIGIAIGIFQKTHNSRKDRCLDLLLIAGVGLAGFIAPRCDSLYALPVFNLLPEDWPGRFYKNMITPIGVAVLAYAFEMLEKLPVRILRIPFEKMGRYSLECYLAHILIRAYAGSWFNSSPFVNLILMLIFTYPLAVAISKLGDKLLWLVGRLPIFKPAESE